MCPSNETPGSEGELIRLFKDLFESDSPPADLILGIGDDAAVFEPGADPETRFVVTTDMLVEDVHFRRNIHSFYDIGWRTAAANLSDVAAMGALPRWGVATIAVPSNVTTHDIMEFARGIRDAMSEHGAWVIGGDLTRSTDKISISMTLIGETTIRVLTRSGAQLGDVIAVTGHLGASGAGLALLEAGDTKVSEEIGDAVVGKHLRPDARVLAGQVFANSEGIHAMMDISDGLGIDLGRLCLASRVGARVFEELIPVSDEVLKVAEALGRDHLDFVNSGEDFELLVTGDRKAVESAARILANESPGLLVSIVGEIIDAPFGINLARVDGSVINPSQLGWDHFRRSEGPGE